MPHALVAGATGIVGTRVCEHLTTQGWRVTGLCRTPPTDDRSHDFIPVDLTDARDCARKLAACPDVTHIIYAARYDHPEGESESVETNAAMLRNLIEAAEPVASGLRHVHLVHGTKYYGHMLGPIAVPVTENAPRAAFTNFYFAHEDFMRERQHGKPWTFSTSRPHTFCDEDPAEPRNAALLIAVYASVARALGEPLHFPGSEKSFHAHTQFTYVPLLARAVAWMANDAGGGNRSYNITNGDSPRWSELWSHFAQYFGVDVGSPRPMRLADYVADKQEVWHKLVDGEGLQQVSLHARVLWPYADYLFKPEWDIVSDMSKARRDGFVEQLDSARMFSNLFDRFRKNRVIPRGDE
ncbi:MAG: SDR family oxidoreductase [Pseudomonadota bacterium]